MDAKLWITFVICNCCLSGILVSSHVALVFPPARKYDFDFLTSHPPCGVPKGDTRTSLLSGSTFNVTWHLAYPHEGGYRLELLDPFDHAILDLTPSLPPSQFIVKDPTSTQHELHLPADLYCKDCSLRIIRQVLEKQFDVYSCADVDIIPRPEYHEDCMGHGRNVVGRCRCNPTFHGTRCEFQEECDEDKDCGVHGRCVVTEDVSFPRRQCYCQLGFFGPKCAKPSGYKTTKIEYSLYRKKELSPDYTLYWRLVRDEKEIEIVMVANGTSWLGIGWKPNGINQTCRGFPLLQDLPRNVSSLVPPRLPALLLTPESASTDTAGTAELPQEVPAKRASALDNIRARFQSRTSTSTSTSTSTLSPAPEPTTSALPVTEQDEEPVPDIPVGSAKAVDLSDLLDGSVLSAPAPYQPRPKRDDSAVNGPFPVSQLEGSDGWIPIPDSPVVPVLQDNPNSSQEYQEPSKTTTTEPEINSESAPIMSSPMPPVEASPEPVPTTTEPAPSSKDWSPTTPFHPMDCSDMVIGMAKGNLSRVGDYYARDRSTPRLDSGFGGKDDLLGAGAFEEDGKTVVIFRRKVETGDVTDHAITNQLMNLLWAKGQEPGQYKHSPASALESEPVSNLQFYKPDVLKYHGQIGNRGTAEVNFFEKEVKGVSNEATPAPTKSTGSKSHGSKSKDSASPVCGGDFKFPFTCNPQGEDCTYYAKWEYVSEKSDEVKFTITVNYTSHWVGIGFADSTDMPQTDVILGWVESSGRVWVGDMFAVGYSVLLDESQDITNVTGSQNNGRTTLSFSRKRITKDPKDMQFADDRCYYFKYPITGGTYHRVSKKVGKHFSTPLWSDNRICVRACTSDAPNSDPSQPGLNFKKPEKEKLLYNMEVKLLGVAKHFEVPMVGSPEFIELADRLTPDLDKALSDVQGFEEIQVQYLSGDTSGNLLAHLEVRFDQHDFQEAPMDLLPPPTDVGDGLDLSQDNLPVTPDFNSSSENVLPEFDNREDLVRHLLEQALASGRLGSIPVDPSYLVFEPLQARSAFKVEDDQENHGPRSAWTSLTGRTTMYCVIGCIIALLIIAVMQATITIIKSRPRASSVHKEQLITNPVWNDYPMIGQSNYAYDTFSTSNNMKPQPRGNGIPRATEIQERVQNGSMRDARYADNVRPELYANNGIRSLNRTQGPPSAAKLGPSKHYPTYSLPRSNQPVSARPYGPPPSYRSSTTNLQTIANQPDFYFMPSQRRSFAAEELPEELMQTNRNNRA